MLPKIFSEEGLAPLIAHVFSELRQGKKPEKFRTRVAMDFIKGALKF